MIMKYNIKISLLAILAMINLASCTKKLDLFPTNELTPDKVYATPEGYRKSIAKVYSAYTLTGSDGPGTSDVPEIKDPGFSDFYRQFWYLQ